MARSKPIVPKGPHCYFCRSTTKNGNVLCSRCVREIQNLREKEEIERQLKAFDYYMKSTQNNNLFQIFAQDLIRKLKTACRRLRF